MGLFDKLKKKTVECINISEIKGEIYAPISGTITMVADTKHSVGIHAENGAELLIHVGMDTVEMNGDGFEVKVKPEDHILQESRLEV